MPLTHCIVMIYYGCSITLTQSEKGLPPEFEFVGVPSMIRKEKGEPFNTCVAHKSYLHFKLHVHVRLTNHQLQCIMYNTM